MTIRTLADLPGAIQTLAKWFYDQWHGFDGRSIESIATQLSQNVNRDSAPITFVAHRNLELLGSVSLDLSDLPSFDYLSPWLASLYVHAPFRGEGLGRALVRHLQHFALSRGIGSLYLWTPGSTQLYERCGWVGFASATYGGQPIKLMHFFNEPGAEQRTHSIASIESASVDAMLCLKQDGPASGSRPFAQHEKRTSSVAGSRS